MPKETVYDLEYSDEESDSEESAGDSGSDVDEETGNIAGFVVDDDDAEDSDYEPSEPEESEDQIVVKKGSIRAEKLPRPEYPCIKVVKTVRYYGIPSKISKDKSQPPKPVAPALENGPSSASIVSSS